MNHKDAIKKCDLLIARIQEMKKSIEEDASLSPAMRAAADAAAELRKNNIRKQLLEKRSSTSVEDMQARQLANRLEKVGVPGIDFNKRIRLQPTNEQLFGHLVPDEATMNKLEKQYNNPFDWMQEASKPLNARFSSPEEEQAYWDSIKVDDV